MRNTSYHIGCSGYYYGYWKGRFYPASTPPREWLRYYAAFFDTVELNGTFYSQPRLSTLQNYTRLVPPHFSFSAKMSRYVTHILRLKQAAPQAEAFIALLREGLGNRLANVLFQLPPSFHYNEENLCRVLDSIPHDPLCVVEFRHHSWWNPHVQAALQQAGIVFCNVDFPGLSSFIVPGRQKFYFRFHGNPELFKSNYSDESLRAHLQSFPKNCSRYYVYFNNTYYESAYRNALRLTEMLGLSEA